MASRHDKSSDRTSCSSTRRPRGRSPCQERSRERSLRRERSASSSCSRRHYTINSPSLEGRVRRIEESQSQILQLLQEARLPAREQREDNHPSLKRKVQQEKEYTPLNTSRTNILMSIKDDKNIRWPHLLKPNSGNQKQYCHFHRSRGHITEECKHLKEEIERLIRRGDLGRFKQNQPTRPGGRRAITRW